MSFAKSTAAGMTLFLSLLASAAQASTIASVSATNDSSDTTYSFSYTGGPWTFSRVYIDTHDSTLPGFPVGGITARYLIENSTLHAYTGKSGSWSWSSPGSAVNFSNPAAASGTTRWTVPLSLVKGNPCSGSVDLIFEVQSGSKIQDSAKITQTYNSGSCSPSPTSSPSSPISAPSATNDDTNSYYRFNFGSGPWNFSRVYIDNHNSAMPGFPVAGITARYLIENSAFHTYTGSGGSWSWSSPGNSVTYSSSNTASGTTQWTVPLSLLQSSCTGSLDLIFEVQGGSIVNSAKITQTLPCSASSGGNTGGGTPTSLTFSESSASILNPERGFYTTASVGDDLSWIRSSGYSLVYIGVNLQKYTNIDLDSTILKQISSTLSNARSAGIKVVLRFQYNDVSGGADAPLNMIVSHHIPQLAPVIAANSDVIAVVQAGLIGAWGEWHDSTNGLTTVSAETQIIETLLNNMPSNLMTQIRTPMLKAGIIGNQNALTSSQAYSQSYQARIGHHNDCFLADATDSGTYPSSNVSLWKSYVAQDGLYTPVGGETCPNGSGVGLRSDCATATAEMASLHYSFLNHDWYGPDITEWQSGGCYDTIYNDLGYRFVLSSLTFGQGVRPGASASLSFSVTNRGYAALYNPRPVYAVLSGPSGTYPILLAGVDPRTWASKSTTQVSAAIALPSNIPAGTYQLSLWLPDGSSTDRSNPNYSIQFANQGIWDATQGRNVITNQFVVSP